LFKKDKFNKKFEGLITAIESIEEFKHGILSGIVPHFP
jgi:hypothetical protein